MSAADTYIVSDVHLGNRHCHLEQFGQFLDGLPAEACLVLNGDIIDEPDDPLPEADAQILRRLVAESKKRQVVWVYGNHDEEVAIDDAGEIQFVERWIVGERVLVMHGDEHDGLMPRHDLFKRLFKKLHRFRIRLGFADVHVADYAKKWGFLYRVLTKHVATRALRTATTEGYDVITCGHTHAPIDMTVEGHRYLNTGCWTETPAFVVIVHEEGVDYRPFPSTNGEVTGGREAPC
ncbi:MAG: UDP-2,3-diacylglucosamine diphosphatase [Candidatus Latescibacterota bacterium]|nr:UDP-2,3-diacylglucosamine diphosphatase [Candidatus Latescibacterota bacterium]